MTKSYVAIHNFEEHNNNTVIIEKDGSYNCDMWIEKALMRDDLVTDVKFIEESITNGILTKLFDVDGDIYVVFPDGSAFKR